MNAFFLIWNHMPWVWLALTIIFAVIESLTLALTTIWFALGAFAMIFISLTPIPFKVQPILFAVISCALLFFTRPVALEKFNKMKSATNANSLIGKEVEVLDDIREFQKGSVKINGVVWSAQSADSAELPKGTKCIVTDIKGNTLILKNLI